MIYNAYPEAEPPWFAPAMAWELGPIQQNIGTLTMDITTLTANIMALTAERCDVSLIGENTNTKHTHKQSKTQ